MSAAEGEEKLKIRVHGGDELPALVYLPGIHGDWTLVTSFRVAMEGRVRFVEITYPRTLTWSLEDYAGAVAEALKGRGIASAWMLGESFGSQVLWPLLARSKDSFDIHGIILAGGFARYPWMWGVRLTEFIGQSMATAWLRWFFYLYAKYAWFRHRHAPETRASIQEFIARRTDLDRRAMIHRLRLIRGNDLRSIVRSVQIPLYHLTGYFDPIVPWYVVRPWLRRNCPGYRAGKTILKADHNVLATAPKKARQHICEWMGISAREQAESDDDAASPPGNLRPLTLSARASL